MPLIKPCAKSICHEIQDCNLNELGINIADKCEFGTLLICLGDGTIGSFIPPRAHIVLPWGIQQDIAPGTEATIAMSLIHNDASGMAIPPHLIMPMSGYYEVFARIGMNLANHDVAGAVRTIIMFNGNSSGRQAELTFNVYGIAGLGVGSRSQYIPWQHCFNQGDELAVLVRNDSETSIEIIACELYARWVGKC